MLRVRVLGFGVMKLFGFSSSEISNSAILVGPARNQAARQS